jgi:hypothetical protein
MLVTLRIDPGNPGVPSPIFWMMPTHGTPGLAGAVASIIVKGVTS